MANTLTPFNFGQSTIRTTTIGEAIWFSAADVCAALGIKNHRDSLLHIDEDEKGVVSNDTLGGQQKISVVNESGLYALVLRSRKPEARKFAKWVTGEVLPSIRKTGGYEAEQKPFSLLNRRFHVWLDENGKEAVVPLTDDHHVLTANGIADAIKHGDMQLHEVEAIAKASMATLFNAIAKKSTP